jgi:hypothetical protein
MVLGIALLVAGCDSPPEAEQKAAAAAVAAAKSAEADKYAAPAYKALTDLQKQAEGFMSEKKYKEAKAAYERAKSLGDDAAKAAAAGKTAMMAEVEKGIAAAEAAWTGLEKQAMAAAKKMKPDMKKAWEDDSKAAQAALKSAKDAVANAPADAKAQLSTVLASIEKWTKDLSAMVMPAPKMPQVKRPAPAKKS